MTFTYTQNTPNANDTVAKTQPIIKNNFNYLRTWALFDHRFSAATTDVLTGAHNKITFPATMAAPGIGTAFAVLYPSNGSGFDGMALQNAAGSFDVTGRNPSVPAAPAEIETCLPGKVLIKTGFYSDALNSVSGSGNINVLFGVEFPTDCRSVVCTPSRTAITSNFSFTVSTLAKTGFRFSYNNPDKVTCDGFYWTAIGTSL